MKVVHVVEPFAAGVATFIRHLVSYMPYDKHVIIHGERPEYEPAHKIKKTFPQNNVSFFQWKGVRRQLEIVNDIRSLISLYRILKKIKNVDVVHLHSSKAGFLGRIVCTILGFKNVIYTPNGLSFMMENHNWLKRKFYLGLEWFSKFLHGKVISTSDSEKNKLRRYGLKSQSIYNGTVVQTKAGKHLSNEEPSKVFRIITCGRIEYQKGPDLFNSIAKHFINHPKIEFIWVGDGPQRNILSSSNIKIKGWLDSDEVFDEIKKADLYLSTSRWEGLPFSVLEAMSFGKALVLKSCLGNQDLVRQGKNGFLINSIVEAVEIIDFYQKFPLFSELAGKESRIICEKLFSMNVTAINYRKAYLKHKGVKALNDFELNPLAFGEKRYFAFEKNQILVEK